MREFNSYYDLAKEDMLTVEALQGSKRFNNIAILCQQVCEKMLKSVAENVIEVELYSRQHKLHRIYKQIVGVTSGLDIPEEDLMFLSDFYIDARYPGDSFIRVSQEEVNRCCSIANNVITQVDCWRKSNGLPVYDITDDTSDDLANLAENI